MQMCMLGLCIFSCILFVVETYEPNYGIANNTITVSVGGWMRVTPADRPAGDTPIALPLSVRPPTQLLEVLVSLLFLADYVLTIVFALDHWRYVFSFWGIVDLISILPLGSFLAFHFSHSDHINETTLLWLEIANLFRYAGSIQSTIDPPRSTPLSPPPAPSIDRPHYPTKSNGNSILRALKVFRVMRFSEASDMSGVLLMPHRNSRRRIIGPPTFDDSNSVSSRVIHLSFWLIGIIFVVRAMLT